MLFILRLGDLRISKITQNSSENVIFSELDNLGRLTRVKATITQDMFRTDSRISQSISIYGSNNLMHKGVTLKARRTNDFF
ncbi:UNVERIFIED_ORG: hypothetical protein ABIC81_003790 [Bacillus proteolyticus]